MYQSMILDSAAGKSYFRMDKKAMDLIGRLLGKSALLVYMGLCYYMESDTETCCPSLSMIAEIACVSQRTVMRVVQAMETLGFIVVEREPGLRNQYRFLSCDFKSVEKWMRIMARQFPSKFRGQA
ncbi:MAG: helix-turn-helix domain-containing protein [Candidatus Omnitrophica bacterium]|nr:helix-turn-helix domain-containing protein [Candidatus Omnitrophota bacterium]